MIITKDNFQKEVLDNKGKVLLDFYANWCGPCKMLAPELDALKEELGDQITIGKINVDEQMELAIQYQVMSIPMLLLFENGKLIKKTIGYSTKNELKEELGL